MKIIYKQKNIYRAFILLLLVMISSCTDNEVDPLFNQTVNERTDALKAEYANILTAAENGWIGYYSPNSDFGVYTMLMDFDEDGSVKINSDYSAGSEDNTITYRLDKTLKIELVLESFAVFHKIFEINDNNNGGEFVFNILSATEDEVVLESKLDFGEDITIFTLRKAVPEDADFEAIYASEALLAGTPLDSGIRNILLNGEEIGTFAFNPSDRTATVTYLNEDLEEVSETVRLVIIRSGFIFFDPITINGAILNTFNYNDLNEEYVDTENSNLIISDFLECPFDLSTFIGTYSANEDGYCDGCYQVTVTEGAEPNTLVLSNLYDVGGTTVITLDPDAAVNNISFAFGDFLYTSASLGDGATYNPSAVTGNLADNISTYRTCDNYMDLYFRVCFPAGCFPLVHIQLTKL